MSATPASNAWGEIVHHESDGILELRWLPTAMTDGSGASAAVVLADRCDPVPPSVRPRRDAVARRLHHPALWRGRREEICLSRPGRFSEHDGVGGQGGLRRPCDLSDRLVFGKAARARLASARLNGLSSTEQSGERDEPDVGSRTRLGPELHLGKAHHSAVTGCPAFAGHDTK